ncbi:TonB family protein [uncultured Alistipes sp.]|uniref:TonB family protein n=1 Tax=uncultured Alistipes sp. TaxID=538949 RepID=UPI0025949994|nr:TonB family protein [uncultured Alistipes sp.]
MRERISAKLRAWVDDVCSTLPRKPDDIALTSVRASGAVALLQIGADAQQIVVGRRTHQQGMYIDLQTLAEMEQERDRLEREVRERQRQEEIDWRSIRNQASNENALNEKLRDDRGTNAAALNEAAAEAEARMRANREAYEQGLAEERAIRERRGKEDGAERQDRKVKGRVTVSFSITDPVRTSRYLEVPAYLCEGGGDVTVSVTVDRAGKVTGARVTEGGDDCMRESALRAARNSLFNIDNSAPARQTGTITYIFIPQ